MNALELIGLIGAVASIVGFLLLFVLRSRPPRKLLSWEPGPSVEIASVLPARADYKLSILYERAGEPPMPVTGAYLRFIRLANLGDEPIRSEDLTPNDPLRLVIHENELLDITVAEVTRRVNNLQLGARTRRGNKTAVNITFDFLDAKDGALLRVLTTKMLTRVDIFGTVIGMPHGVRFGSPSPSPIMSCGLMILLLLLWVFAGVASVALFRRFMEWDSDVLWLPFAGLAIFVVPVIIVGVLARLADLSPTWPDKIRIPQWAEVAIRTYGIDH